MKKIPAVRARSRQSGSLTAAVRRNLFLALRRARQQAAVKHFRHVPPLLAVGAVLACVPGRAATTATWEMNTYRDFLAGRFSGVLLSRDGRLALAPKAEALFTSGQPVIWSVVKAPDGTLYAGTGHHGRVFRIDKSGQAAVVWTSDQPEVFALALDAKGALYAATSPDGKIYRIENGKAAEYFAPGAKYIWALAFAPGGVLYAGTGNQGKIYRIESAGSGDVYYDTGQSHVTCLAFDGQGRLLAGSEPNGILYRITAKDKAFALYDASLPEIRTIVPMPDGSIIAAALGGSISRRALGGVTSVPGVPASASVSATAASITVEAQGGVELKPKPETEKPPVQAAPAAVVQPQGVDITGVEKSAIYQVFPDNTVEKLWSSKEEDVYDVLPEGSRILFSTDEQGRIYALNPDRKVDLLAETNEGEVIRLLAGNNGVVAATGDMGKLYSLTDQPGSSGTYESPVHDAGGVARWGRLSWRGDRADGGRVTFRTRAGNSSRPDGTWSEWSEPLADPAGSLVRSPNARYIQWKAEFSAETARGQLPQADAGPEMNSVTLAYLPQNTPPVVKSINVVAVAGGSAKAAVQAQGAAAAYSVTVTDTDEAGTATSAGTPAQTLGRAASGQIQITWQAEDADGDRLVYAVYFRGEDEREWKLLKRNLMENTYSIDGDSLADGKYYFRVTASDSPSNPPASAREAELVSSPVLIDRTPPLVTLGAPKRTGSHVEIEVEAADAASALRRCEYSLDAGPWTPMEPVHGIVDSPRERFVLTIDHLTPGEHLVVVRAVDSANNAGLAKVLLR